MIVLLTANLKGVLLPLLPSVVADEEGFDSDMSAWRMLFMIVPFQDSVWECV